MWWLASIGMDPFLLVLLALTGALAAAGTWYALHFKAVLRDLRSELSTLTLENRDLRTAMERDELTAAYSRNKLFSLIEDVDRAEDMHVLWVDLDNLGTVNDGHGYETSDRLLTAIAASLMTFVGDRGTVARIGGDEFCVVLHTPNLTEAQKIASQIGIAIAETEVMSGATKVSRSASIGITPLHPGQKLVSAIILAEDAMTMAKAEGRNRVKLADDEVLQTRAKRGARPTIEELQDGLNRDEITYYVQPIWDIQVGAPVGVEALIRWITPDGEVRLPETFVDTMTDGYHLELKPPLEAANRAANAFTQDDRKMFCAFNISSRFLERSSDLSPEWINELLHGVPPDRMIFEIVESAVIQDPEGAKRVFQALRDAGVRVALDDFGTGLSNLERLREFAVDIVKIDRQFITELDSNRRNAGILDGLIEMSKTLDFEIIAEGVETETQLETVRASGIRLVQGFLLGRPAPVDEWLERLT